MFLFFINIEKSNFCIFIEFSSPHSLTNNKMTEKITPQQAIHIPAISICSIPSKPSYPKKLQAFLIFWGSVYKTHPPSKCNIARASPSKQTRFLSKRVHLNKEQHKHSLKTMKEDSMSIAHFDSQSLE